MNTLVRLHQREDGQRIESKKRVWCLVYLTAGDPATFCGGEYFTYGCSSENIKYDEKTVRRGGITCNDCMRKIKEIKAVCL